MQFAPIALFTYNRLSHVKRTVEALQKNLLASESDLFVFLDGPRSGVDSVKVNEVLAYIEKIDGFRRVRVLAQSRNLGLSRSIIRGVTEIIANEGRVIVLEDDMVTSRYFLKYMNEALDLYQDTPEVASVHGYIYPVKEKLPETFFLRGADCWGWGTWKRAWDQFDADGVRLLSLLKKRRLMHEFDYFGAASFGRMLADQTRGRNDSWAIRWHASTFLRGMVTLYPNRSLVNNIGNDSSGEHCGTTDIYDVGDIAHNAITVEAQLPVPDAGAIVAIRFYFLRVRLRKLWNKMQHGFKMLVPFRH